MSDSLEYVRQLAARARLESPPTAHVSGAVMLRLSEEPVVSMAGPLTFFAAAATMLAVLAVFTVLPVWESFATDPATQFFQIATLSGI